MADLFAPSAAGIVDMPAGTYTGHLRTAYPVIWQGAGVGRTIIRADGTRNSMITIAGGTPVDLASLRDCTLDMANLSAVVTGLASDSSLLELEANNVEVINSHRGSYAAYNERKLRLSNAVIEGSGGGVYVAGSSTSTVVASSRMYGGRFGLVTAGAGPHIGVVADRFKVSHNVWASPTYEAVTVTGYGTQYADVVSNVTAHRNLYDVVRALTPVSTANVRKYDRVEAADGTWTEVLAVFRNGDILLDTWREVGTWGRAANAPLGTLTYYRVSLGRLYAATSTRLTIFSVGGAENAYWRGVEGGLCQPLLIAGSRVDIIRHAYTGQAAEDGVRDVDTGAFQITDTAVGATLTNCEAEGGFSDQFTLRGVGTVATACKADNGQDMGFTVDGALGPVAVKYCLARRSGFNGFTVVNGPSSLLYCCAEDNGTHNSEGYGVVVDTASLGSTLKICGSGNLTRLVDGATRNNGLLTLAQFDHLARLWQMKRRSRFCG